MSTIKNDQILLYCCFNKIIKGPGTSYRFPALRKKHDKSLCHTAHYYLTKFHFDSTKDSKKTSVSNYDDVTDFKIYGFCKNTKI